jgi:hypothetical protein
MDTEENEGNRAEKIARKIGNPDETVTWDELREFLDLSHQKTIKIMDDVLNSRWTWGTKKTMFMGFKILSNQSALTAQAILSIYEQNSELKTAMKLLNAKINAVKDETKEDMEKISSEFNDIVNSSTMQQMQEYLKLMDETAERRAKAFKDYSR